jgi:nicotinate-nucleotide pyrophosphorylase (carboxylating)
MFLPRKVLEEKLLRILAEDVGQGDITTGSIVPADTTAEAEVVAKDSGIVAGIEEGRIILESLALRVETLVEDGGKVRTGQVLIRVFGDARTILTCERTLLNIVSRMSGIATATRKLAEKLQKAGLKTKVACTRKVAPGLLYFDKKAVLVGGGDTHRLHLDDLILIKDNHITIVGDVGKAVKKARDAASFSKKVEVEASRVEEVLKAAKAGADAIMLDNFSPEHVKKACASLKKAGFYGKVVLEASGGITGENILEYASTGVDIVSLGEITSSVRTLDMSLEIKRINRK